LEKDETWDRFPVVQHWSLVRGVEGRRNGLACLETKDVSQDSIETKPIEPEFSGRLYP